MVVIPNSFPNWKSEFFVQIYFYAYHKLVTEISRYSDFCASVQR